MGVTDQKSVAEKLVFGHLVAARWLGEPAMQLSADEAGKLVKEYQNLCEHYGVSALPPVVELWVGVLTTVGMIYGPRAAIILAKQRGPKKPPGPAIPGQRGAVQYPPEVKEPPKNTTAPPPSGLEAAIDANAPNGAVAVFSGGTASPLEVPQGRIVF